MAGTNSDSRLGNESTREILDDWNPTTFEEDVAGEQHERGEHRPSSARGLRRPESQSAASGGNPHFSWDLFDRANSGVSGRLSSSEDATRQTQELLAGFELVESQRGLQSTRSPRARGDSAGAEIAGSDGSRSGEGIGDLSTRKPARLPQPGELLAGFRILVELGRGAFARVYLAEEVNLGRRAVAIKVSSPDGEEPQILARLQHTHIVPVHSVCDDPESGLRVLCMPYFGGANLAQVLEASGGLIPTHHDGRSLVKALDQVSRNFTSQSNRMLVRSGSTRRVRGLRPEQAEPPRPASQPVVRDSQSHSASRFRSLLARWVGPRAVPAARAVEEEGDHDQPSRQFLHGASAVQAAVWIVARLADGLEHAHSRGLLHRDLKPSNILLAGDGTPMLLDFNLAVDALPQPAEDEVRRAFVGGTLPYMAPEHLDAFNPKGTTAPEAVDERSDIYSLGLILYEMLAGEHPFPEAPAGGTLQSAIELLYASRRDVPSLKARCPEIPWSLDALVSKCLAFEPAARYARARDLAEDLHRYLDNLPMKYAPEPSLRERMGKFARRHPALCGTTSLALISILLIGILGTAVVKTYSALQGMYARVKVRQFDGSFTEIQFLLNTASGSEDHLKRGMKLAAHELDGLEADTNPRSFREGWPGRLTASERRRLREQIVELIMLEARARVTVAARHGSEQERRLAIERAITKLDEAEELDPEVPSALYEEKARYHAALGLADLAADDRRRATLRPPTTCHDLTLAGTTLFAAGDFPRAEEALRHALQAEITSFWAWYVLGHCHYAQKRYLEAAGDFAARAAREPKFAWVHFNRGLALAQAGRLRSAHDSYDRAVELEPQFAEAFVNRALVELELNEVDRALADLTAAIKLGRYDLIVLAALGETLARLDRREDAERYFASILERDRNNIVAHIARGITRLGSDPKGAEDDFRQALASDDRSARAHYGMAPLARKTDLKRALDHLDRALDSDPNLIDAVQLRAFMRARLGERGALSDVDRLVESPTPNRLYNAACAVAILSETTASPRLLSQAFDFLTRALEAGCSTADALDDPDLKLLRASPRFAQLIDRFGGSRK